MDRHGLVSEGSFAGKVALVTGAGSGIGEATAKLFAHAGTTVVVSDLDVEGGNRVVREIEAAGGSAAFIECDVTSEVQVSELVERTVATFGRLDAAHNNAGNDGSVAGLIDQSTEDWVAVMDVNAAGVFYCMRAQLRVMVEQGGGAIVNTASIAGLKPFSGMSPYVASKFAVIGLTKAAALDYGRSRVRVNAVCPGAIRTPMVQEFYDEHPVREDQMRRRVPLNQIGEPDDIAGAVVWLCSDAASYLTGSTLVVDGGAMVG